MKNLLLALCLGLFSTGINAQDNIHDILTSGKWYVESVQEKGEEPEISAKKDDEWILYHSEGKTEESLFGELSSSSWTFDKENSIIKLTGSETIFHKIIEITGDKLIVELIEDLNDTEAHPIVTYIKN